MLMTKETTPGDSHGFPCRLRVTLPWETPVVGIKFDPNAFVERFDQTKASKHTVHFTWLREQTSYSLAEDQLVCYVHPHRLAKVKCKDCWELKLPVAQRYNCCRHCFTSEWKMHKPAHPPAAKAVSGDYKEATGKFKRCGRLYEVKRSSKQENRKWIVVGCLKSYLPTSEDLGSILRLESVAIDVVTGAQLTATNIIETYAVITRPVPQPRQMIGCAINYPKLELGNPSELTFTVLSYNVLADLYVSSSCQSFDYCPRWALLWECRGKKFLDEIIGYDADILCLQEVQSDHFKDFFEPELRKCGYSGIYNQKFWPTFSRDHEFIGEGCATFYRCNMFREVTRREIDFTTCASNIWGSECISHFGKGDIALITGLKILEYEYSPSFRQSTIFVANTHISAKPEFPDVKLFQVGSLVNYLERLKSSGPLLICGTFNSLPLSDPHKLIVRGSCNPAYNEKQDPFKVANVIKLQHEMHMASAYASFLDPCGIEELRKKMDSEANEPRFTKMTPRFMGTLDYIFYTEQSLRVEGLLDLLQPESLVRGLPSPIWPSDHIALMARFRLLKQPHIPPNRTKPLHTKRVTRKQNQVDHDNSTTNFKNQRLH